VEGRFVQFFANFVIDAVKTSKKLNTPYNTFERENNTT
jgi:hypothetical protein